MNKRIKLLAKQADIDYDLRPEIARAPVWIGTDEELERFAQSIVAECCQALHPMLRDQISRGQGVDLIKKHFGVAE
jgi:hypothetical protein